MSRHQTQSDRLLHLTNELELSTFLNKGILQTNSEHKLRIAELERENAVLRAAESRLSRTEDALEDAEKRLRERENAFADAEREWGAEMQKELEQKERAEGDRDEFQRNYEKLWEGMDGFWEGMKESVPRPSRAGSSSYKPRVPPVHTPVVSRTHISQPVPTAPTSAKSRPQIAQSIPTAPASVTSRPRNSRPAPTALSPRPPRPPLATPPSPPLHQVPASTKRRRRTQESASPGAEEIILALPAVCSPFAAPGPLLTEIRLFQTPSPPPHERLPSPPPRSRLPSPPPRTGTLRLSGGQDLKPPLLGVHPQMLSVLAKKRAHRIHSEDMHIKIESQSPVDRRSGIDSDDDPLAMYD